MPPHSDHARIIGTILGSITDFAYAFDRAGRFVFINRPLLDLWGLTLEQAVGKNFFELGYPDPLADKLQRQIQEVIDAKSRVVDETPYTNPAGMTGFYEYIFSPVFAPDGSVELVAGSTRDITARKKTEADLRTSQERFVLAVEASELGTFYCPIPLGRIEWNAKCKEHFFLPADAEVDFDLFYSLIHPEDRERTRRAVDEAVFRKRSYDIEYRTVSADGSRHRWVRAIGKGFYDAAGQPTRFDGITIDVTDRKEAEAERERLLVALRNEQEKLAAIVERAPAFMCTLRGPGHVFELANQRYYEIVGRREIIGKSVRDALPEIEGQGYFELLDRVYQTGETFTGNELPAMLRRTADGPLERRFVNLVYQPIPDAVGTVVGIFVHGVDVTDLVRAREANERLLASEREARSAAEQANLAKDRFLAMLSHELRTPLTPVAMAAASMEKDPALPAGFRDDVAMIRRNVELETQLIDDLLDLSRIMSGKMRLRSQPTGVHNVIRHVLETVGAELHDKGLRVETDLKAEAHTVEADAARLQQVLWNLLKNSAKFTPAGGVVTIRTRSSGSHLVIDVADTGKGIAADVLSRIFEPFEQGNAGVTTQYGGMGLGLAIAKAVVELHGGTIRAASKGEGWGATFTITLPLVEAAKAAPAAGGQPDQPVAGRGRSVRVLLVEDHADTAKTLARLLKVDGMDVEWADCVSAGLRMAAASPFDVVVSDLGLPDGTGHDLMRELCRERRTVGIAMSGYGMEEDIRRSQEAGFVEHLVKPVNLSALRQAIRRATARFDGVGVE